MLRMRAFAFSVSDRLGPRDYQGIAATTPVGFESTRGDRIGLAGRRLNHSAKVSCMHRKASHVFLRKTSEGVARHEQGTGRDHALRTCTLLDVGGAAWRHRKETLGMRVGCF